MFRYIMCNWIVTPWPRWQRVRTQRLLQVQKNCVFMSVTLISSASNCLTLSQNHQINTRKVFIWIYDRQSLLEIGSVYKHQLSPVITEKLQGLCLLLKPNPETAASPTDATHKKRRRRRCERGQKRGKHGGIQARLRANPTRPAIQSLMPSKVRSLENKPDLTQSRFKVLYYLSHAQSYRV